MSLLRTSSYWRSVEAAYAKLGGKFTVAKKNGSDVRQPANHDAWMVARELGATGSRKCNACGETYEAKPGDVLKHCNKIMAASMQPELEKEIHDSIGKYKIAIQKKQANDKPNPGPYSDDEWKKIQEEDRALSERHKQQTEKRKEKEKKPEEPAKKEADKLFGGKADDKGDKIFPKKELEEGAKHEKEHTTDKGVAKEIAKDHLVDDKKYYNKLEKIEKKDAQSPLKPTWNQTVKSKTPLEEDFERGPVDLSVEYDSSKGNFDQQIEKIVGKSMTGSGTALQSGVRDLSFRLKNSVEAERVAELINHAAIPVSKIEISQGGEYGYEVKKASYSAHFVKDDAALGNSYWVVKDASAEPVLKVTLSQAFPGKEATKAAPFSTAAYGEKLVRSLQERGIEKTVASKDGLNGRAVVYKSAQANPMAPDLFQEQTNVEEAGNQGQKPVDPQADKAMVDKDTGDEILADKEDHSDVIELLKSAVVPFLVAGKDVTVEQFVQELKALCQDDDLLNEFQGSLDEMVKNFENDEDKDKEDEVENEKDQMKAEQPGAQPETGQPPANQQPMLTASKLAEAEDLRRRLSIAENSNRQLLEKCEQLKREAMLHDSESQKLLAQNKMLMIDRTMRIRHPRCAKLAQMRVEIGEADDVQRETVALLKMPSGEFEALEKRVMKVHARVAQQTSDIDTTGVLHFIPEPRGEEKTASLNSGPHKANGRPGFADVWSKPTK